ncbi:VWA domain-containing protein [Pararhizobium sp. A13]|uniref:TadE/TadG family type IV pilus assembly protein n=1 Tax=Pararhizobium sp. A13 TaxID=3133975 RepID=UPI00324934C0
MIADRRGNVAISAAICAVPMILAVGASLDYTRAYNVQSKMQADLDAALVAAIKQIDTYDEEKLEKKVTDWFEAQADKSDSSYDLTGVTIDQTNHTITATATGTVPTTIMTIANIESVPVGVISAIKGPATSYLDVYLVIDKSASMLLAAHSEGQTTMRANAGCEFACHTGDSAKISGISYTNFYDYSIDSSIELRTDIMLKAVDTLTQMIDTADPSHNRIRVGLYRLSTDVKEVLSPQYSTSNLLKVLNKDSNGLTSSSSTDGTYFQTALSTLKKKIGESGDGSSAASPLKLVMMITDGVQSARSWVGRTSSKTKNCTKWTLYKGAQTCVGFPMTEDARKVTPLNPDWCDYLKGLGATVSVLYTEYLPITLDWGYNGTLGNTMSSSVWTSTWGGTLHSGVSGSISRQDYIPIALQDCASSPDLFISAASEDEITEGLSTLFNQYLTSVRLTQ